MVNQKEIRLSGSGGQGLILGGIILAEAALLDGKNAIQSQSYGPEARGGASKAEVIISDDTIDYPKVEKADLLLALTDKAYHKYIKTLKDDGILIIDSNIELDDTDKAYKILQVPIIQSASEKIGKAMVANIVALGVIRAVTDVVTEEALENAVLKRVPKGTEELNKAALQEGYLLAKASKNK
ncbi:2-oxoacid:acceptor oxidoreductase family protein [Alkaliphilus peptidifermentans]|uniref:2-oxoglutarate ferredoxin oxidoreductase, gamma subunit n=1 Tax=Alkaliphilus peptidifermentans DSM 18978 TaxID=1120976 RepID=A0A1G5KMS5_9FIRM|nr:2-oxoacid:acceptor oxidoreductase family protein [Alkaliphilus peptidifermentans]SCZ01380.1 2-oxoglutarate ferredoxin oxidoreductase, gamma subunit [Alkaliphilus peptidifermentans DSM 18978]